MAEGSATQDLAVALDTNIKVRLKDGLRGSSNASFCFT